MIFRLKADATNPQSTNPQSTNPQSTSPQSTNRHSLYPPSLYRSLRGFRLSACANAPADPP